MAKKKKKRPCFRLTINFLGDHMTFSFDALGIWKGEILC